MLQEPPEPSDEVCLESTTPIVRHKRSVSRIQNIEDTLDTLPKAYDIILFNEKCSLVFEHVYESYPERNTGIYATAS